MTNIIPFSPFDPLDLPSFEDGYAGSQEESAYPELWEGLVGLWLPGLGKQGGKLYDISGHGNHGILKNMDPATDWVTTGQRGIPWALDFDGADDYVAITLPVLSRFSLSVWCKLDAAAFQDAGLVGDDGAKQHWLDVQVGPVWRLGSQLGGVQYGNTSFDGRGVWVHCAYTYDATTVRFYLNGAADGSSVDASQTVEWDALAASDDTGVKAFLGCLSGTSVWNCALSPSEIQLLYEVPQALTTRRPLIFPISFTTEAATTPLSAFRLIASSWISDREDSYSSPMDWAEVFSKKDEVEVEWLNVVGEQTETVSTSLRVWVDDREDELPSFEDGYAGSQEESEYPNLWDGLVRMWAPTLGRQGGVLYDLSGRKKHGALMNIEPSVGWVMGNNGYSLNLVRTSSQYVLSDNITDLVDMTVTVRVDNVLTNGFWTTIVSNVYWNEAIGFTIFIDNDGVKFYGQPSFFIKYDFDPKTAEHVYSVSIVHNLAVLYIDGVEVGRDTSGSFINSSLPTLIGARHNNNGIGTRDYFDGEIDFVSIHNRALSSNEVMEFYRDITSLLVSKKTYLPIVFPEVEIVEDSVNVSVNTDWLSNIITNPSVPVSWLGVGQAITAGGSVPVAWLLNLDLSDKIGVSYIKELESNLGKPVSWTQVLTSSIHELNIAFKNDLAVGRIIPVEWASVTTAIEQFGSLPVEWRLAAASIEAFGSLPIDWSFTSTPLLAGSWILDSRGTVWVLGSRGQVWTIDNRGTTWTLPSR